jgi:hypothetical protein
MKSRDYQQLFVGDFASRRGVLCAYTVSLLLMALYSSQDGLLFAGCFSLGGFSSSYAIAAMISAFGLTAACACELSRFQAAAGNIVRGQTGSTPVWGIGQTSYATSMESRGYNMDVKHQLKIALVAREVTRAD